MMMGMGDGCRGVTTKNQVSLRDCALRYPGTKEEKGLEGSVQERRFSLPQKSLPAFICGTSTMTRHQNLLDPEMPLLTFLFPNSESAEPRCRRAGSWVRAEGWVVFFT